VVKDILEETPVSEKPSETAHLEPKLDSQEAVAIENPTMESESIVPQAAEEIKDPEPAVVNPLVAEIDTEIAELLEITDLEKLETLPPFEISLGAKSAIGLLASVDLNKTINHELNQDMVWCFRLLFQFTGQMLPEEDEKAWEECKAFLAQGELNEAVFDKMSKFDFSNENIDKIEKLVGGNRHKIDPNYFNAIDELTGFLIFAMKDAVEYAGIIPEKRTPARHYSRL
jgi:hypothetical protein